MKKLIKQFFCKHSYAILFSHKVTERFCTISHYKGYQCLKCNKRKITEGNMDVDREDLVRDYRQWVKGKKVEKISYNGRTFYF